MIKILYFLLNFLFLNFSFGGPIDCETVGESGQIADLTRHGVILIEVVGNPSIGSAVINTQACNANNAILSPEVYIKLQDMAASAMSPFVILKKINQPIHGYCDVDVKSPADIFTQNWSLTSDVCVEKSRTMRGVRSSDGRFKAFVNELQAKVMISRNPASLSKKVKSKK